MYTVQGPLKAEKCINSLKINSLKKKKKILQQCSVPDVFVWYLYDTCVLLEPSKGRKLLNINIQPSWKYYFFVFSAVWSFLSNILLNYKKKVSEWSVVQEKTVCLLKLPE